MNNSRHTFRMQATLRAGLTACLAPVLIGSAPFTASAVLADDEAPEYIELTGVVRDFVERNKPGGHPDMERRPDSGFGLYTGNVAMEAGPDGKPVFTGEGARVNEQFKDAQGRPIAPHMYNRRYECQIGYPDQECVDISHASSGPGGDSVYRVCFVEVDFNADGTSTWWYSVEEIAGRDLSHWTLWLNPNVEVVADGTTPGWQWIGDDHPNFPGPGIKWDMGGGVTPGLFQITVDQHYYGSNASWVQAKGGGGTEFGQAPFFGPSVEVSSTGSPYKVIWTLVTDQSLGDQEGVFGSYDSGGITSAESFNQWFRDVPGVNLSKPQTIRLVRQNDGSYVFDDKLDPVFKDLGGFFPIEHELFGQSGGSPDRNFHFTFELHTEFVYDAEGNQFFEFIGDDDVWVFIDGKLVIDLGGVHAALHQGIDLNRLCLEHGNTYTLSFFFAERHRTQANCRITTNIELTSTKIPSITAMFD